MTHNIEVDVVSIVVDGWNGLAILREAVDKPRTPIPIETKFAKSVMRKF